MTIFALKTLQEPHSRGHFLDPRPPLHTGFKEDQLQSLRVHKKLQLLFPSSPPPLSHLEELQPSNSPSLPHQSAKLVEVPLIVGDVVPQGPVAPTVNKRGQPHKNPQQFSANLSTVA